MLFSVVSRICAAIFFIATIALAASPTSFCKCTCFGSYKIIPLDARPDSSSPDTSPNRRLLSRTPTDLLGGIRAEGDDEKDSDGDSERPDAPKDGDGDNKDEEEEDRKEYRQKNCNDCNKRFCLSLNLPECKDAEDKDVFTTCFQRDSSKDEAVVFLFIFATVGLLGWATVKPCLDGFAQRRRERHEYIPVSDQQR